MISASFLGHRSAIGLRRRVGGGCPPVRTAWLCGILPRDPVHPSPISTDRANPSPCPLPPARPGMGSGRDPGPVPLRWVQRRTGMIQRTLTGFDYNLEGAAPLPWAEPAVVLGHFPEPGGATAANQPHFDGSVALKCGQLAAHCAFVCTHSKYSTFSFRLSAPIVLLIWHSFCSAQVAAIM